MDATHHDVNIHAKWILGAKLDKCTINLNCYPNCEAFEPFYVFASTFAYSGQLGLLHGAPFEPNKLNKSHTHGFCCKVMCQGVQVAMLGIEPLKGWAPHALLHFNPSIIAQLGVEQDFHALWQTIFPAGVDAEGLWPSIGKIEIAVDSEASACDYLPFGTGRKTKTRYKNTFYLGPRRSPSSLAAYDKGLEQAGKAYPIADASGVYRVEQRLRKIAWGGLAARLEKEKNLLLDLHIVAKADLAAMFPPQTNPGFWNAVTHNDLNTALKGLPPKARQKLLTKLKTLPQPDWYQPDAMWKQMKQAALACPYLQANSQNQNV
jgi:hypothetical protein